MKIPVTLCLALLLASCNPSSSGSSSSDTQTTTNTVTTVTTTTPVAPAPPPAMAPTTLTQANLDRVQNDMSPAEVEAIFGPPTSSQSQPIPIVGGTQTTYNYQNGGSAVTITFKNNQVKAKSGTFGP
jgi:hypothetical protein